MTLRIRILPLALEHCWSIAAGSCLSTHPYSPDLAPSDYHRFTYLKNWLVSQRLNNNKELMGGVRTWLSLEAANFFSTGIPKLITQNEMCLSSGGDYVDKELKHVHIFCI
jgi:hypothetical protein